MQHHNVLHTEYSMISGLKKHEETALLDQVGKAIQCSPQLFKFKKTKAANGLNRTVIKLTDIRGVTRYLILGDSYANQNDDKKMKLDRLGSGGYGHVKKAYPVVYRDGEWHLTGEVRAMKIIQLSQQELEECNRELLYNHNLKDGSYGSCLIDGKYYLDMKYVDGKKLHRSNPAAGSFTDKLKVATQLSRELSFFHRKGVAHNDIQAGNVLYNDQTNNAEFIDFGRASQDKEVFNEDILRFAHLLQSYVFRKNKSVFDDLFS